MAKLNDAQGGVNTPESAVLTGISNLFRLVFVTGAIAFAWLVGIGVALYYSWVSKNGSFAQGLATNGLAGLILLVACSDTLLSSASKVASIQRRSCARSGRRSLMCFSHRRRP